MWYTADSGIPHNHFSTGITLYMCVCVCVYIYIYIYPVRTAQYTHSVSVIQTSQLMPYREIIAVCAEIHTKHINTLCWQNVEL